MRPRAGERVWRSRGPRGAVQEGVGGGRTARGLDKVLERAAADVLLAAYYYKLLIVAVLVLMGGVFAGLSEWISPLGPC